MNDLIFALPGGGRVLFTQRADGNLSSVAGPGREQGEAARERVRERIGASAIARGYQVHGTFVRRLLEPPAPPLPGARPEDADGQATSARGLATMVLAADCLPVAIGCEGAVAMVHAGWHGLAGGVIEEGVAAVRALAPSARELGAVIGPGAGPCCYEVGPEVREALGLPAGDGGRAKIDLCAVARERLLAAGVRSVENVAACTICDERFFSHRREGAGSGRMAGLAWLS
jgi:hypothetical protein